MGGVKANVLSDILLQYTASQRKIRDPFVLSLNVLACYLEDSASCKDEKLVAKIQHLKDTYATYLNPELTGLKTVSEPPAFDQSVIKEFFSSRNSVRSFSDTPITRDEIKQALDFASCTPTACNRQTSRVYAFRNRQTITALLDNQLGDQGWCLNGDTIFVVTGNESYFGATYERRQTLIDGGLYAMNFVYGLHLQHIASCFKMFVCDPERERQFRTLAKIPENEIPIVLIVAGHYKNEPTQSPKSHRMKPVAFLDGQEIM